MWPISLLWTVLAVNGAVAATTGTARTGTTSGRARRGGVRVRMCVLLLLLVLLQVVVWMMVGVMATVVVHHHLLLMMVAAAAGAAAATATSGQFLLAVDAARQQHYRTIGPLLQRVVLHRDWIAIVISEMLKDVTVQVHVLLTDLLLLGQDGFALAQQPLLAVLHLFDLVRE